MTQPTVKPIPDELKRDVLAYIIRLDEAAQRISQFAGIARAAAEMDQKDGTSHLDMHMASATYQAVWGNYEAIGDKIVELGCVLDHAETVIAEEPDKFKE